MKSNTAPLFATTLIALAGAASAAPLPAKFPQLTPSEIKSFPPGFDYSPTFNYDPTSKHVSKTQTTVNNGDGDGNSGGKVTSAKNSGNNAPKPAVKAEAPAAHGPKPAEKPKGRRGTIITGDGDANSGNANVHVANGSDNGSDNTHESSSVDSHDRSISTHLGLFRRHTTLITGDGDGNSGGSIHVANGSDNGSDNKHESSTQDSHDRSISTSLGLFRRGRTLITGDGDGNSGGSIHVANGSDNSSDNKHESFKQDSHNVAVSTGLDLPIPF